MLFFVRNRHYYTRIERTKIMNELRFTSGDLGKSGGKIIK